MQEGFLKDIAMVLGVAAVTSVVARRFRLPPVLGYLIAGFVIGPYIPLPFFADQDRVETLSEFGVILVMFAVGLEFRIKRFFQVLPTSGLTAAIEISVMGLCGIVIGDLLGWNSIQSIFMGGALAISSTMIVSKVFEESPPDSRTKDHIFGVLVIQDIVAILLLTVLGAVAAGSGLEAKELFPTISRLVLVLIGLVAIGLFVIPRFVRAANRLKSPEVSVIVATGVCFSLALLVEKLGFSVALGSFLAGILVAESGEGSRIETLTKPLKDMFSAVFFVSIGMTVDPFVAVHHLPTCLAITLAIIALQFLGVSVAGVLSGVGFRRSLMAGLSLGQIGEFAFIIAAIGGGAKILPPEFQSIIVTVAILTSLCTPFLWSQAPKILNFVDAKLPSRVRMMVTLYEEWFGRIRGEWSRNHKSTIPKRISIAIAIDTLLLILLPHLFLGLGPRLELFLKSKGVTTLIAQGTAGALLIILLMPILYSLVVNLSRLISIFTDRLFPLATMSLESADISAKKLFQLTLQTTLLIVISLLVMAGLEPFLNFKIYIFVLSVGFAVSFWLLWKSAGQVETEIESGGEKILNVLSKQSFPEKLRVDAGGAIESILPGFDNMLNIEITNNSLVIGKTLIELDLRATTGATIVSIRRKDKVILFPSPQEKIFAGDVIQLSGDLDSKTKAREALKS